jgi:preprotein translocase subunit SecG
MIWLVSTLFILICILLIVVVLLQKGRGGGLGAAFGGMGSSAFGTRVGDVFTWVTIVLTALFLLLAIGATMLARPDKTPVARPMFSPLPEEVPADETVTITMDSDTMAAEIYYTLDDNEPTQDSKRYEAPIEVEPGTTVKARAYRSDWPPSAVTMARYGPQATQPADNEELAPFEEDTLPTDAEPTDQALPDEMPQGAPEGQLVD